MPLWTCHSGRGTDLLFRDYLRSIQRLRAGLPHQGACVCQAEHSDRGAWLLVLPGNGECQAGGAASDLGHWCCLGRGQVTLGPGQAASWRGCGGRPPCSLPGCLLCSIGFLWGTVA